MFELIEATCPRCWHKVQVPKLDPSRVVSVIVCPKCGHQWRLGTKAPSLSLLRNPWLVLAASIVFYAFSIYAVYSGQIQPKPGLDKLAFVLHCLPALAIFWAVRKALGLHRILAALIALIGPVTLAFVWFWLK
jgi:hypothetical protein